MKVTLDIRKTVEENANSYFEAAKKDKKKIDGTTQEIVKILDEHPDIRALNKIYT